MTETHEHGGKVIQFPKLQLSGVDDEPDPAGDLAVEAERRMVSSFVGPVPEPVVAGTGESDTQVDLGLDESVSGPGGQRWGERTPVIPAWVRDRRLLRARVEWTAGRIARLGAFHGVRVPWYWLRLVRWAPVGLWYWLRSWWCWAFDFETRRLRRHASDSRDVAAYVVLQRQTRPRTRERLVYSVWIAGGGLVVWLLVWWRLWPSWVPLVSYPVMTVVVVAGLAGLHGRPATTTVLDELPDTFSDPSTTKLAPEHLNEAFRAVGLLRNEDSKLVLCAPLLRDGKGWAAVIDLPRGGGKTALDALGQRTGIAAELGVDEIQVIMERVRAAHGGHAGRISLWVADDDPYLGKPVISLLERAEKWSLWDPIPFGQDARGQRVDLSLMWQSMFFGGLPRRGKTFAQRLPSAAGALDPYVRHYVADGKGGSDWMPMRQIAHRLVTGAEDDALEAFRDMLRELVHEMEVRFATLRDLPSSVCPEGKLTPQISKRYNMPVILLTVDELQEYLTALDKTDKDAVLDDLCRIARRGPAAGFISNFASQRPDAESVPARLREIISYRYCTQVVDKTSSDMVLGKGKAGQGADASILSEEHKGVGVLVTGPGSHVVVRCDYLDLAGFEEVCQRGRTLRVTTGTLTGDAQQDRVAAATASDDTFRIPPILSDCLDVMRHSARIHTTDLLDRLTNLDERYGDWDGDRLANALEHADVVRTTRQVKIGGRNLAGYRRADLEDAIPVDLLQGGVEGPSTRTGGTGNTPSPPIPETTPTPTK